MQALHPDKNHYDIITYLQMLFPIALNDHMTRHPPTQTIQ